jgi:UDP:flavonoid glycosyltransferase YjiC (YdhE family)
MPYADVYVSNGGYGGVLLSVQNNLPMVVAGVHEGKNEINARVGYFELGINLKTETPSVSQIRRAVEEIMADKKYADHVASLAREFQEYRPEEICARHVARLLRHSRRLKEVSTEAGYIY